MATTLLPLDPATSPQLAARILVISANLLPAEVIDARRARKARGVTIVSLLIFMVLLVGWYGYARLQTNAAQSDLEDVGSQAQTLQQKQSEYADVVNVQAERDTIAAQLKTLLANDLNWQSLLGTLRSTGAAASVTVQSVSGTLTADEAAATNKLPSSTSTKVIGTLTVTGAAPDKDSLAKYVEALGRLKVIANPYLNSATETDGEVQFTLEADITASALGGRFSTARGK
jgi:Tfp pilus assembly protein PilN